MLISIILFFITLYVYKVNISFYIKSMNRSGHKVDPFTKKDTKLPDQTKLTKRLQHEKLSNQLSKSNTKHKLTSVHKNSNSNSNKKLFKLKQPDKKYQDYKSQSTDIRTSKQSSTINIHNSSNDYCVNEYFVKGNNNKYKKFQYNNATTGMNKQKKNYNPISIKNGPNSPNQVDQNSDIYHHYHHNYQRKNSEDIEVSNQPFSQEYGFEVFPVPHENKYAYLNVQSNYYNKQDDEPYGSREMTSSRTNKISSMMKKIGMSDNRALITDDGKIVNVSKQNQKQKKDKQKQKQKKKQLNKSNSQNTLSFSTQYLNQNKQKRHKSKSKSKIKSKSKLKTNQNSFRVNKDTKEAKQKDKQKQQKNIMLNPHTKNYPNDLKQQTKNPPIKSHSQYRSQQLPQLQSQPGYQKFNIYQKSQRKIKKSSSTKKQLSKSKYDKSKSRNQQSKQTIVSNNVTRAQNSSYQYQTHHSNNNNNNRYYTIIDSSRSLSTTQGVSSGLTVDLAEVFYQIQNQSVIISGTGLGGKKELAKFNNVAQVERMKCINLIGKVCGQLKAKRETLFLTVCIFDKYLFAAYQEYYSLSLSSHSFSSSINMKKVALTSVVIALKIDLPETLPKYCLSFRPNPQITIKKTSSSISKFHKKKKSQMSSSTHHNHSSSSLSQIKLHGQKDSLLDTKDKLTYIVTDPIYESGEKQQDFHIGQILQMEIEIMSKLKYRFYFKTYGYWIDLLTSLWDNYLVQNQDLNREDRVMTKNGNRAISNNYTTATKQTRQQDNYFSRQPRIYFRRTQQSHKIKHHKDFKILSYLIQICQSTLYFPQITSNKFKPSLIVLSAMYLLIRINLQQKSSLQPLSIYQYYLKNLSKSCNIVFCQQNGVNQLFGNFLSLLNLNLSHILQSIQFVSRFIQPEYLKIFNFDAYEYSESYEEKLSLYYYNQRLICMVRKQKQEKE